MTVELETAWSLRSVMASQAPTAARSSSEGMGPVSVPPTSNGSSLLNVWAPTLTCIARPPSDTARIETSLMARV